MKFLTIDDAKVIRIILENVIKNYVKGCEVLHAENGAIGLQILHDNPDVKIVFVDWNMPVLDGFEFVKKIRQNPIYNDVKIIMATTESQKDKVSEAAKAGINGYIVKPFNQEIIDKVLAKYLVGVKKV